MKTLMKRFASLGAILKKDTAIEIWLKKRWGWNNWHTATLVLAILLVFLGTLVWKFQQAMAMPTTPPGVTENTFWTYETKWKYPFVNSFVNMDAIHIVRGTTEFQVFKKKGENGPYVNYLGTTYEEFLQNIGLKGKL